MLLRQNTRIVFALLFFVVAVAVVVSLMSLVPVSPVVQIGATVVLAVPIAYVAWLFATPTGAEIWRAIREKQLRARKDSSLELNPDEEP